MNELYQRKGIQKQTSFHTAPHSGFSEDALNGFYTKLSSAVEDIPLHSMLFIGSDMNAKIDSPFSFYSSSNRNGLLLLDFINQHNLSNRLYYISKKMAKQRSLPGLFKIKSHW